MRPSRTDSSKRRRQLAATSTEYILILTLVVIPVALLSPLIFRMITLYTNRLLWAIALPFG